jgi:hypothetical protein
MWFMLQHSADVPNYRVLVYALFVYFSLHLIDSDPDARVRYDTFGPAGLNDYKSGSSNASDEMWEDLAQWVRDNKKAKKPGKRDQARAKVGNIDR